LKLAYIELNEQHQYSRNGLEVSGVTNILHVGGCVDEWTYSDHARWRGSAVHAATHFHDENDLDERGLPREIRSYLHQWKAVRANHGFEILAIEKRVYSNRYSYAGTIDRIVRFTRGPWKGKRGIIDIKTNQSGYVAPAAVLQMTGYGYAENPKYLWPRLAVCLQPDDYDFKSYGPESFTEHLHDWLAVLRTARWREANLLKGKI
jgi:hypothetical protein